MDKTCGNFNLIPRFGVDKSIGDEMCREYVV